MIYFKLIYQQRGCFIKIHKLMPAWNRDTVYFDRQLVSYVEESAKEAGIKYQ